MKVIIDGDSLVYTIGFASQKNIWQAACEEGIVHFEHDQKSLVLDFIERDEGASGVLEVQKRIEVSPVEHAFHSLKVILQKIATRAKANSYKIYLTGAGNFREQVATIMGYKHNRLDAEKPVLYQQIRDYLVNIQKATIVTGMEADDALSIVHAKSVSGEAVNVSIDPAHEVMRYPDECIIAAIDKDLRNIPGKHINFDKRVAENDEYKFITISEDEGRHTFWMQVLTGDSSDNILGIPGMGPKKADALLEPLRGKSETDYFWAVYAAYKHHFGVKPFEYFRFDAYADTTATYRKRELKPEAEILPEQRLVGSALNFLLENARLLWMLRVQPNAEGTHWWMPPLTFEEIAIEDDVIAWDEKEAALSAAAPPEGTEPFKPWSEGRGRWFWTDGVTQFGKFGTEKKVKADIAEWKLAQVPVDEEVAQEIDAAVANEVGDTTNEVVDTQIGDEDTQTGAEHCLAKGAPHAPEEPEVDTSRYGQLWVREEDKKHMYTDDEGNDFTSEVCEHCEGNGMIWVPVQVAEPVELPPEEEGPDFPDGTDAEGFPGGDERMDNSPEEASNNAPELPETTTQPDIWDTSF